MIRSLVRAVPGDDGSVTFFGDMAQQVYGRHRIPWNMAGLKVSKVWELTKNYRNSKQIAQLAIAISEMPYYSDVAGELVTAEVPVHDGPLPTLVRCSNRAAEVSLAVEQATAAATTKSVAILFRRRRYADAIVGRLPSATEIKGDMPVWKAEGPGIYYGTYHSVGGMEFDLVVMPFLSRECWPDPDEVEEAGADEAASNDGRLLYVGVTRARRQLILTHTGVPTSMLPDRQELYARLDR
jgi:superfamily I DNA/RNA helicase